MISVYVEIYETPVTLSYTQHLIGVQIRYLTALLIGIYAFTYTIIVIINLYLITYNFIIFLYFIFNYI